MNSWPVLGTKRALSSVDFLARWKDTRCFIVGSGTADVMKDRFTLEIDTEDPEFDEWAAAEKHFYTNVLVYDPMVNKLYINLREVKYVKKLGWAFNNNPARRLEAYPGKDAAWQ